MTNSKQFRRSCSLRMAKSPSLLDYASGSFYDPLEEADLTQGPQGAAVRQSGLVPSKEQCPKIFTQSKGHWRRATSLRVQKVRGEESAVIGEAAHSLGPDDGQLLIGKAQGMAGSKMKKCKKQVNRAFREGWETFVSNLYSLTLSQGTGAHLTRSSQPRGAQ